MTRTLDCCKRFLVLLLIVAIADMVLMVLGPQEASGPSVAAQVKPVQIPIAKLPWQRPMLLDKSDETGEVDLGEEAKVWIDKALAARGDAALIPAFRPWIANDLLIYRTFCSAQSLYLKDNKKPFEKAGAIYWKSPPDEGSLGVALTRNFSHGLNVAFEKLLAAAPPAALPQFLLENQLAGAISHDDDRVYVVHDLAVPLPPGLDPKKVPWQASWEAELVENRMRTLNLISGKIVWVIDREYPSPQFPPRPLPNSHFLAAPLPFQKQLYALNENNKGEQRLVVLDPAKGTIIEGFTVDSVPDSERYLVNQRRRLYTAQMLADDNLLVCIPHTGKVLGFDIAKRKVLWTFNYQKNPPPKQDLGNWKSPAPFLHDGKLVFTASDDDHVHCVNVQDGKPLWQVKRTDDLYLAGIVGDKVLLVGHSSCRALALKDGKELWKLATGTPCGIGALDKTTYLLPLKKGAASKQAEIAYLDVDSGKLIGVSPLAEMPGNLLLHGEYILSQSATTVTGYKR